MTIIKTNQNRAELASRQRGVTTLAFGMIVLITATLITLFAAKVSLIEQAISGNEYKSKSAFEAAQGGLDLGQMYLRQNILQLYTTWTWTACNSADGNTWPGTEADLQTWIVNNSCDGWLWTTLPDANKAALGNGLDYRVFYLTEGSGTPLVPDDINDLQITVVAEGVADQSQGSYTTAGSTSAHTSYAFNRVIVNAFPLIPGIVASPLTATGTIVGSGTFDVVTNPDGAGTGTPVSAWSGGNTNFGGGTPKSCFDAEYFNTGTPYICNRSDPYCANTSNTYAFGTELGRSDIVLCDDCTCPISAAMTYNDGGTYVEGIDFVDTDGNYGATPDQTNFPDDLFHYIFGVDENDWSRIHYRAARAGDCSGLSQSSSGLIWIEGDCHVTGGDIGSAFAPVLLIVEGETTLQGNARMFGVLFSWDDPTGVNTSSIGGDVNLRGGTRFYGALLSDHDIDMGNGTYQMIYNKKVLDNLRESLTALGRVPGTWSDFTN